MHRCSLRFSLRAATSATLVTVTTTTRGCATTSAMSWAAQSSSTTIGNLQGLRVAVYMEASETAATDLPVAMGKVTTQLSHDVYAVSFNEVSFSPVIEVGSRVYITSHSPPHESALHSSGAPVAASSVAEVPLRNGNTTATASGGSSTNSAESRSGSSPPSLSASPSPVQAPRVSSVGGLVAKVNGNGTFGILLDNDKFEATVLREHILLSEGRSKLVANERYAAVLDWVKSAGVDKRSDQESTAAILFSRGWRAEKLYLLDPQDVNCLSHLNKSVRMSLLEKADWEREHQRQRRDLSKERLKEKDFRYVLTKYSSVFSACVAVFTAISVFTWNFKNWRKGLRTTQLDYAVSTLTQDVRKPKIDRGEVTRTRELERLRQLLRRLDVEHPRVVVVTGSNGAGKSHLLRKAAYKEGMPALFVDVRGNEDPLRAIVKSLGVQNIDVCGDLLDFISEACELANQRTMRSSGAPTTPLIVMKLRDGSLQRVYNESVALACDRRLCHVMIETPIETITLATSSLPRLDFYTIPNFSVEEAFQYTQHLIDPLELMYFIDIVGTNSNDLDELIAQVVQRQVSGVEYTNRKLVKAMRQLQNVWQKDAKLREAVLKVAQFDYEVGLRGVHDLTLKNEALRDIVFYDAVADRWMLQCKLFHSAAQAWM